MEKIKKINYVGIIDAIIFIALIFAPYIIISGGELKIYGSNLMQLANIGAIPYEVIPIFEIVHEYAMNILMGFAIALLFFSIFPIALFNVLFIIVGVFLSIVFILLDVLGFIVYFDMFGLTLDLSSKVTIGIGAILPTLGGILMVSTGIVGLNMTRLKN